MFGCRPSLNHYLLRRSRRDRPYACIAISKGNLHLGFDQEWTEIGQQVGTLLLEKRSPARDINRKESKRVLTHKSSWLTCPPLVFPTPHAYKRQFLPWLKPKGSPCQILMKLFLRYKVRFIWII